MIVFCIVSLMIAGGVAVLALHPAFGRLPRGERLARIEASPNYRNGAFRNLHPTEKITSDKGFVRNMWNFMFNKDSNVKPSDRVPAVKTDLKRFADAEDVVVWLGHSSLYIQQNGVSFLVDPVLTNSLPASLMLSPFQGADIYSPDDIPAVDYLLITHDHWDHLDYGTVTRMKDRIGKVICPLGVREHFEYWGYSLDRIIEMDWNEAYHANDDVIIHCLPARHFSGRFLKEDKTLWAAFMIDASNRIFISGDGGYDSHFNDIAQQFPVIDLAIMENGQYNKDWSQIHLLPDDLVKAIDTLAPIEVMTYHNSKFALALHSWDEPMRKIRENASGKSWSLLTPVIGQSLKSKR